MLFILTAIAFVVIFSILVLIHECGHFFVAKKCGIKVEEFGFGLPPRIWGVKKGETIYSVNWIPFGGFVRLLGEDATDKKVLTDKRSFSAQSARSRVMVILAGVTMNFLLALLLLTIGFTFGIQPLISNSEDVYAAISDGTIQTKTGVYVSKLDGGSDALKSSLHVNDQILAINGQPLSVESKAANLLKKGVDANLMVVRDSESLPLEVKVNASDVENVKVYDSFDLPRVVVNSVKSGSIWEKAGLKNNDSIIKLNGKEFFDVSDFSSALNEASGNFTIQVYRNNKIVDLTVTPEDKPWIVITDVSTDGQASKANLKTGDVIVSINNTKITNPAEVVKYTRANAGKQVDYNVLRGTQEVTLPVKIGDNGLIGVNLSKIEYFKVEGLSLYEGLQPTSILKVYDVKYPFYLAPVKAFEESIKLSVLTGNMFIDVIHSVVTKFVVPEGVSGPVGIAKMTSVFVQEGIMSLLRFMALLSLSLAIVNVLPLPALDGGRFFFIVLEVIIGKRINPKFEALVHAVGFILLIGLILVVSYNDILALFK